MTELTQPLPTPSSWLATHLVRYPFPGVAFREHCKVTAQSWFAARARAAVVFGVAVDGVEVERV